MWVDMWKCVFKIPIEFCVFTLCPLISMPLALLSLQEDRPGRQPSLSTIYHVKQPYYITSQRLTGYGNTSEVHCSLFLIGIYFFFFSVDLWSSWWPEWCLAGFVHTVQLCVWQWKSSLNWKKQQVLSALSRSVNLTSECCWNTACLWQTM